MVVSASHMIYKLYAFSGEETESSKADFYNRALSRGL
jgi:hypothetical protein